MCRLLTLLVSLEIRLSALCILSLFCPFQGVMISQSRAKCPIGMTGLRAVRHAALGRELGRALFFVTLLRAVNRVQCFERSSFVAACATVDGSTSADPTVRYQPCHKAKIERKQPTRNKDWKDKL